MTEKSLEVQVGIMVEQNKELTSAVKEVASGVSTLLQFQAAQHEINRADQEWKHDVEKHQDKQDDRIEEQRKEFNHFKDTEFKEVRDGQRSNSLLVNLAVGVVCTVTGGVITYILTNGGI